ncbi:lytic transglycosylase [Endozoicomonas ascidiicola]|uniref:lytic transglycosylase n=1 Tax=Endozoicomonas ascidiicola TaxID=1698521 RepID=UPI000B0DBB11|nr:LysM peptidoglycan-binding domain-containing protein [Endozoicomonas ascidiicola]
MIKAPQPKDGHPRSRFPANARLLLSGIVMSSLLSGCQVLNQSETSTEASQAGGPTLVAKSTSGTDVEKVVQPVVIDDLWVRIQSGLAMDLDQNNSRIQAELNWYTRHKNYFNTMSSRAAPYLYFIVKEAEARKVPLELALMPIVESSFDPFAYSHAGASGLWQFMPETGEHYNLDQNWWYDGRRDVVASTRAALDYMVYMHGMFDDWELALAAFNSGPGRVLRAVKKNQRLGKSTRFWALDLPKETTAYVPKLIALAKIVRDPKKYGMTFDTIANKPYFAKVNTNGQLDLAKASELSGVDLKQLYQLNPGLNRWSTPPEGPHYLVVPLNHAEQFRTQLAALPAEQRLSWQRYVVKAGDNLGKIANDFNTSIDVISEANKLNSTIIRIGQGLLIPVATGKSEAYTLSASQRLAAKQNRGVSGRSKVEYRVKSGDSFWSIARKYEVGVSELTRWNNLSPRDTLRIDQALAIWTEQESDGSILRKVNYTVRSGDSLAKIASRFNVEVNEIQDWNNDLNGKYIHPGQRVIVFVDVTDT